MVRKKTAVIYLPTPLPGDFAAISIKKWTLLGAPLEIQLLCCFLWAIKVAKDEIAPVLSSASRTLAHIHCSSSASVL